MRMFITTASLGRQITVTAGKSSPATPRREGLDECAALLASGNGNVVCSQGLEQLQVRSLAS